jgi:hypothetical protein
MSQQETNSYIEMICNAIQSYKGFTTSEKEFAQKNMHNWIDNTCCLNKLVEKFSEISIDIKPFIKEKKLAYAS